MRLFALPRPQYGPTSPSSRRCRECARTGASTSTRASATPASRRRRVHLRHAVRRGLDPRDAPAPDRQVGDGLLVLVIDVTEQRRMEAELRGFAESSRTTCASRSPASPTSSPCSSGGRTRRPTPPSSASSARARSAPARSSTASSPTRGRARCNSSRSRSRRSWTRSPRTCRPRLVETGATLDVGDLPEVRGDARQLRRLLQNLVANAVKFRGPTRPRIAVSAREGGRAVGRHGRRQRDRRPGRGPRPDLRHVHPRAPRPRRHGHRPRRLPPCRRGVTAGGSGSSPPTAAAARSASRCRASETDGGARLTPAASTRPAPPPTARGSGRCRGPRSRGRGR